MTTKPTVIRVNRPAKVASKGNRVSPAPRNTPPMAISIDISGSTAANTPNNKTELSITSGSSTIKLLSALPNAISDVPSTTSVINDNLIVRSALCHACCGLLAPKYCAVSVAPAKLKLNPITNTADSSEIPKP